MRNSPVVAAILTGALKAACGFGMVATDAKLRSGSGAHLPSARLAKSIGVISAIEANKSGRGFDPGLFVLNCDWRLRATEAFAAVQALVARAVADRHVTAVRARRRILLEMRHGIAQRFHRFATGRELFLIATAAFRSGTSCVFRDGQFRSTDGLSFLSRPAGRASRVQVDCGPACWPAVFRDELHRHPTEHVVGDGGGVADLRIFRETARLER